MKPFDLEKALAGEPVVTIDGKPVTEIFVFTASYGKFIFSIIDDFPKITPIEGTGLFMAEKVKVKKDGWVCVHYDAGVEDYICSRIYDSESWAKSCYRNIKNTCCKITWEEEL